MTNRRLGAMSAGMICAAMAFAPQLARAEEPVPPPMPAAHEHGRGSWWPTVIGAVAGAYLWPMVFPAITEVAVAGSAGPVESALGAAASLPATAAETVGVEVPAIAPMDTVSAWRLSNWYSPVVGALHGAYLGHFFGR